MPTADTNNNITVTIYDGIATLGTDYNTSGITSNIHLPLSKMIWGNDSVSRRVSSEYPMPVDVMSFNGNSGAAYLIGVTGNVYGLGSFNVVNSSVNPLHITGVSGATAVNISGHIQGITNGTLVGITTGPIAFSNTSISIFGISGGTAITITGGRYLNSTNDSVRINGISLSAGLLGYTLDSVRVRGSSGELHIPVMLQYLNGNTLANIGTSGDALKVNVVNTGITFTVNLTAVLGVTNASEPPLKVQGGAPADNPLLIKYYNATAVPISTPNTIQTEIMNSGGTFGAYIQSIVNSLTGSTGTVTAIKNNTNLISTINDKLTPNGVNVKVVDITKPNRITNNVISFTNTSVLPLTSSSTTILRSGINLKAPATNTSTVYVGSDTIIANRLAAYPLEPGESLFIECNTTNVVYCYTDIDPTKQKLIYLGT